MITILITIGLSQIAIGILVYAYLETQDERELHVILECRWLYEERVLKAEKALALDALERILDIGADHKVDEIALDAIISIRNSKSQ